MEEKKSPRNSNPFRAIFSFRNIRRAILGRNYNSENNAGAGFTLVELLIVIVVIGVLTIGAITIFNPAAQIQKAQDARRKDDLSQMQKAFQVFYQDNGKYPKPASGYEITGLDGITVSWGDPWQPYMNVLPKDSNSSKNYVYYASSDRQAYYLYASLDRGANDPQVCNGGSACTGLPADAGCGGICNYGVSSPNVSP